MAKKKPAKRAKKRAPEKKLRPKTDQRAESMKAKIGAGESLL
jgi:hypothetical protein